MKFNLASRHIFMYGIGVASTKALSLIMLPIVTRLLSPAEYGTLEVLLTLINLLSIVMGCGLNDAIFRFGGMAATPQLVDEICGNAAFQALILGVIFNVPLILFAGLLAPLFPADVTTLQIVYLAISLIPANVLGVQLDWLRLKDRVYSFVYVSLIRAFLQAAFVLITLAAGYGVTGMMFASIVSSMSVFLYFMFIQLKGKLDFSMIWQKKLFFYGLPLSFSGIAEFVTLWLATWWLAFVVGAAEMAKYALAMKFAGITYLLLQPIMMWWYPNRFKSLDSESGKLYTARITEAGVIFSFLSATFIAIASSIIINLLIPVVYHESIAYLPWLCFALALKNAGELMGLGLYLEKTSYTMVVNVFTAVLAVLGFSICIPMWHAWGVIVVLNLCFLSRGLFIVYLSQQELFLAYRYFKLSLFVILSGVGMSIIQHMSNLYQYFIEGGAICLAFIILAVFLQLVPRMFENKESTL